jgi:hypothetical protein
MGMADGDERVRGGAGAIAVAALAQFAMAPVVGRLVRVDATGGWVEIPGQLGAPVPARSLVPLDAALPREVLLVFEESRLDRPIVVGFLQDPAAAQAVARVDGQRVVIEGKDEIELRCGSASIVLRRNGRVVIRGLEVETRARGVNRIRGGSVRIN